MRHGALNLHFQAVKHRFSYFRAAGRRERALERAKPHPRVNHGRLSGKQRLNHLDFAGTAQKTLEQPSLPCPKNPETGFTSLSDSV